MEGVNERANALEQAAWDVLDRTADPTARAEAKRVLMAGWRALVDELAAIPFDPEEARREWEEKKERHLSCLKWRIGMWTVPGGVPPPYAAATDARESG
jgi:hypothetical protein